MSSNNENRSTNRATNRSTYDSDPSASGSSNAGYARAGVRTRRVMPNDAAFDESLTSGAVGTRSPLGSSRLSRNTTRTTARAVEDVNRGGRSNRRNLLVTIGAVVVFAIILVLAVTFVMPRIMGTSGSDRNAVVAGKEVEIIIPDGSGAGTIAQLLEDEGIVESTEEFLKAMRHQDAEQSLKSGTYVFYTGSDAADVVRQLVSGPNATGYTITIPEGYTLNQIAALVEANLGVPSSDFVAQAKVANYSSSYSFLADATGETLEGFLFPKTYDFAGQEVTADTVIRAMLDQYGTEVSQYDWTAAIEQLQTRFGRNFTTYDVLIVASIIERETNTPGSDGTHVASVIYNRLAYGMMLQCDSTSVYANNGVLTVDIVSNEWDNPYNTYANYGLPPTPICSPGIKAIEAALYPDRTEDLYFFISGDYHVFSDNYDDHLIAIENAPSA